MGFVVTYATIAGLSGLVPHFFIPGQTREDRDPWIGLRFFLAGTAIPLLIYVFNLVFNIGLRASAWTIATLAMVGAARLIWPYLQGQRTVTLLRLTHPIFLVPLAVIIVIGSQGGLEYIPINGIEVSGHLYDTSLRFATDTWLSPDARFQFQQYTPAWSFFLLYPTLVLDEFGPHPAATPVLMHLGLLALIYDLVPRLADPDGILKNRDRALLGWITVLTLLGVEAFWRLFPLHLVMALGQIYTAAAIFTILMAGLMNGVDRLKLSAAIGFIFAVGYIFKAAGITLGLSLGVIWLAFVVWEKNDPRWTYDFRTLTRRAVFFAVALLGPGTLIYLSWKLKSEPQHCLDSVSWYIQRVIDGKFFDEKSAAASKSFVLRFWNYVSVYKLPVSLLGASLIALSVFLKRFRWISFAVFAWIIIYFGALWIFYIGCGYDQEILTTGRYARITLRPIHGLGIMLAIIFSTRWAIALFGNKLKTAVVSRSVTITAALFVATVGIWQASVMVSDIVEVGERLRPDALERGERYKTDYAEVKAIKRILHTRKRETPSLLMIHQGGAESEIDLNAAVLLSVNVSGKGPIYHYNLNSIFKFHPDTPRWGVLVASEEEVPPELLAHDVIWPIKTDKWFRKILAPLLDSAECIERPEGFFLFKTDSGDNFECIAKSDWVNQGTWRSKTSTSNAGN